MTNAGDRFMASCDALADTLEARERNRVKPRTITVTMKFEEWQAMCALPLTEPRFFDKLGEWMEFCDWQANTVLHQPNTHIYSPAAERENRRP